MGHGEEPTKTTTKSDGTATRDKTRNKSNNPADNVHGRSRRNAPAIGDTTGIADAQPNHPSQHEASKKPNASGDSSVGESTTNTSSRGNATKIQRKAADGLPGSSSHDTTNQPNVQANNAAAESKTPDMGDVAKVPRKAKGSQSYDTTKRARDSLGPVPRKVKTENETPPIPRKRKTENFSADGLGFVPRKAKTETIAKRSSLQRSSSTSSLIATMENPKAAAQTKKHQGAHVSRNETTDKKKPTFRDIRSLLRDQDQETFDVEFPTETAMGYYFENMEFEGMRACQVRSVSPMASGDNRIQKGSVVLSARHVIASEYDRCLTESDRSINNYQDLQSCFMEATGAGHGIQVTFANIPSQLCASAASENSADNLFGHNQEWNEWGKWRGSEEIGWAGGAHVLNNQSSHPDQRSSPQKPQYVHGNSHLRNNIDEKKWEKVDLLRPIVTTTPVVPIMAGARKQRGATFLGKKKIGFGANQLRQYEKESETSAFFVLEEDNRTKPSVVLNATNSPKIAAAERREYIRYLTENGSFMDLLGLFEEGYAYDVERADFLDELRASIRDRRQARDFAKKDTILKIYIHALQIAANANALKYWSRVYICLERLVLKGIKIKSDEEFRAVVKITRDMNGKSEDATIGCFDFSGSDLEDERQYDFPTDRKVPNFPFNVKKEQLKVLEIDLKRKGKDLFQSIGQSEVLVCDLYESSVRNSRGSRHMSALTSNPANKVLPLGCHVSFKVQCELDEAHFVKERRDLCHQLKDVMDWVGRFNNELTAEERQKSELSFKLGIGRTTLLRSAIILAELNLVQRLLSAGAVVDPGDLELAENEASTEDCFSSQRIGIAKELRRHTIKRED